MTNNTVVVSIPVFITVTESQWKVFWQSSLHMYSVIYTDKDNQAKYLQGITIDAVQHFTMASG